MTQTLQSYARTLGMDSYVLKEALDRHRIKSVRQGGEDCYRAVDIQRVVLLTRGEFVELPGGGHLIRNPKLDEAEAKLEKLHEAARRSGRRDDRDRYQGQKRKIAEIKAGMLAEQKVARERATPAPIDEDLAREQEKYARFHRVGR
jgi:hypothetical protein